MNEYLLVGAVNLSDLTIAPLVDGVEAVDVLPLMIVFNSGGSNVTIL